MLKKDFYRNKVDKRQYEDKTAIISNEKTKNIEINVDNSYNSLKEKNKKESQNE